jgi:hypothetical protein
MRALKLRSRRRIVIALVALSWLAQQLGFAAHGEMQRRMAAGGGHGDICTSAGLARAPVDPAPPAEHPPSTAVFCDVCAGSTLGALGAPAPLAFPARSTATPVESVAAPAIALAHPQGAHRPRAPPALLS